MCSVKELCELFQVKNHVIWDAIKGRTGKNLPNKRKLYHGGMHGSKCPTSTLIEEDVIEIRKLYNGKNSKELSEKFKTSPRNIKAIVYYQNWKHI